jgi:hypothetical protein
VLFPDPTRTPWESIVFGLKASIYGMPSIFTNVYQDLFVNLKGVLLKKSSSNERRLSTEGKLFSSMAMEYQKDIPRILLDTDTNNNNNNPVEGDLPLAVPLSHSLPKEHLRRRDPQFRSHSRRNRYYLFGTEFFTKEQRDEFIVAIAFMMAIGVAIGTGGLLGLHLYLAGTNQTTLEMMEATMIKDQLG